MAAVIQQYEAVTQNQHSLYLLFHAFWTANSVVDPDTGAALEYFDLKLGSQGKQWIAGTSNEIGWLAQGVQPNIFTGSNTIHFIHPSQMPLDRQATYLRIVARLKPNKSKNHRVRFTVEGNRINCPGVLTTPTVEM